jgi:hypothetical protein
MSLGVSNNILDGLTILFGKFARSGVRVNSSDLADQKGESATDTSNLSHAINDFSFTINVSVEKTDNVSEISVFFHYQALKLNRVPYEED